MKKELKDFLHFYLGCNVTDGEHIMKLLSVGLYGYVAANDNVRSQGMFHRIKPILRRLSDITEDEQIEADRLMDENRGMAIYRYAERVNYYRSIGIDCDELIEAGLAIDATTIKA